MSNYQNFIRNSDEIVDKLYTLDYLCKLDNIEADLVILGGSGILLFMEIQLKKKFRPTRDIDVNLLKTNKREALYRLLSEVDIDIVGGVMEVPPLGDFKEAESLFKLEADFSAIQVFVPDIELLACSKIFSKREKDLIDLKETTLLEHCDKDKLLEMVEEYTGYLLNPSHPDLNLHQLTHILNEKGI